MKYYCGRGSVERCSLSVFNLIILSVIHQGTFSVPYLIFIPEYYRQLITKSDYEIAVQNAFNPPSYCRDPNQLDRYIFDCHFLPYINNEHQPRNKIFRQNLIKLN